MKDVKIRISVDSKGAEDSIDKVADSTKKLSKANSSASKSNASLSGATAATGVAMGGVATASATAATSVAALGGSVGAAAGGMAALKTKLQSVIISLKSVKVAMMATGIGLVVVLLAALKAAFTGSEEGQNKFAKIMGVIGAVTGNLVDILADLGDGIISAFENPKKSITDFANLIKTNITNRFDGLMELIPALGKAFEQLFSGEFAAAAETAGNAAAKVALGIDDLTAKIKGAADATKDFINQNIKEGAAAAKVADQRAKADKIERGLLVRRAIAEKEIAELRLKAKDLNNVSAEERQAALMRVLEINDSLAESEVAIATLRSEAQTAENTFARSTKENLLEEERLKAAVIAVETKRIDQKRQVQRELSAAENEINRAAKEKQKAKEAAQKEQDKKDADALKAKIALKKKIAEFSAISEEEKRLLEKDKLRVNFEELMKQLGDDEDAKLELTKTYLKKQKELKDKFDEEDKANREAKSKEEIDDVKAVADTKLAIQNAALGNVGAGLNLLSSLAEDNKALQATTLIGENAVGIATNIINTQATNAKAGLNPAIIAANNVRMGIGIAASVAATAKGLAALGKSGGGQSPQAPQGNAPSFNLVEGTDDSSAIQRTIEGRGNTPVKAYVTSGDITTAQQADRQAELNSGF
tara:strand:+ start:27 stop:1970 length:1944 start_codon:yes stop_codon:yes gene_type:complete